MPQYMVALIESSPADADSSTQLWGPVDEADAARWVRQCEELIREAEYPTLGDAAYFHPVMIPVADEAQLPDPGLVLLKLYDRFGPDEDPDTEDWTTVVHDGYRALQAAVLQRHTGASKEWAQLWVEAAK